MECVNGCIHFDGGEIKHHKDCPYYPESMSKRLDELEEKVKQSPETGQVDAVVSVPHDEFELDDEATSYAKNKPEGYSLGGAFKDGALWMIGHLKKKVH